MRKKGGTHLRKGLQALVLLALGLVGVGSSAQAAIINVPGDASTIQDAVDAAVSGDTIRVAADTYLEQVDIYSKEDLKIIGEGFATTIIDANIGTTPDDHGIDILDSNNILIQGFTVRNAGQYTALTEYNNINIYNSSLITIDSCRLTNAYEDGVGYGACARLIIENSEIFSNNDDGTDSDDDENVYTIIRDCQVYNNGHDGIDNYYGLNDVISGNTITNNGNYGYSEEYAAGSQILNNVITGNGSDGIYADCYGAGNLIKGNTVIGNDGEGIYAYMNYVISKNEVTYNNGDGIYADYGCSIIKNLTAFNDGYGIDAEESCLVKKNRAEDNTSYGIYSEYACTTVNNRSADNESEGIDINDDGNIVNKNKVFGNDSEGIYDNGYSGNLYHGNRSVANTYEGIYTSSTDNATITKNLVAMNHEEGIGDSYMWQCYLANNKVLDNYYDGVSYLEACRIENNTILNNGKYDDGNGLYLSYTQNEVTGNTIKGSAEFDINDDQSDCENFFKGNNFNTEYGPCL